MKKEETETKEEIKEEPNTLVNVPAWIIKEVDKKYKKAVTKHPVFPTRTFEQFCIIHEKLGEAIKEWNNLYYHGCGNMDKVKEEIRHTIVTCIRMLGKNEK